MASTLLNLRGLSGRLKARQRELILEAAAIEVLPPDHLIQKIATLENVIVATETLIEEERARRPGE